MKGMGIGVRVWLAAWIVLSVGACQLVTTDDVKRAVRETNEAIVEAQTVLDSTEALAPITVNGAELANPGESFERAVASINSALEKVAPDSLTADALRFRKGWLLMNSREFDRARAAFDEMTREPVRERDLALFALREPLIFWFQFAPASGPELATYSVLPDSLRDPEKALARFTKGIDDGAFGGEIRHWLEIQRALWTVKLVAHVYQDDPEKSFPILNEGLDRYASGFSPPERGYVAQWAQGRGPLEGARWYLTPELVVGQFRQARADADPPADGSPARWPAEADWLLRLYPGE